MADRQTWRRWAHKARKTPPRETARLAARKVRQRAVLITARRRDRLRVRTTQENSPAS